MAARKRKAADMSVGQKEGEPEGYPPLSQTEKYYVTPAECRVKRAAAG
jgi:hypothetical protein